MVLSSEQEAELIKILKARFENNMHRHQDLKWADLEAKMAADSQKLWSLSQMEKTGGEPDVVGVDPKTGEFIIFDCSAESPVGRRSLCYDHEALLARKRNKPADSVINMATAMGIQLLSAEDYRYLQKYGIFDSKTSSWILTPPEIRVLGGAIFADFRYGSVFVYHNGVESYYSSRGFRGSLRV